MLASRLAVALIVTLGASSAAHALQIVTLDFDTFTTPDTEPEDHVYTPADREAIFGMLSEIYRSDPMDPTGGPFGVKFEILDPLAPPPPFTTSIVKFNNGAFGSADGIDFRNQDDADDVDVNALGVLGLFVDTPRAPELGGGIWTAEDLGSPEAIVFASAQIAAHELGHALGLRHHDAFGPIGAGIGVSAGSYTPTYPGPVGGTLTGQHIMGLNSSVALSADTLLTPSHLNARSSLKLTLAAIEGEIGPNPYVADESEYPMGDAADPFPDADTSPVPLFELSIPNTLESPHPWAPIHGGPEMLPASAGIVTASIEPRPGAFSDTDHFELTIDDPSRVTIEVISEQNVNTTEVVNPNLVLLDGLTALPVGYEGGGAFSGDQFESTDSILFDVDLAPGTYVVEVFPDEGTDIGDYELLVYAFPDVEFPLIGDYNEDLIVDAADYVLWRDSLGTEEFLPNRIPGMTGPIGPEDYEGWAGNFGEFDLALLDSMPASAVPEPSTVLLATLAWIGVAAPRTRRVSLR